MNKAHLIDVIRTAFDMRSANKARNFEIHEYLCRTFGARVDNKAESHQFEQQVRMHLNDLESTHRGAIAEWIVCAYQWTGDRALGFHHLGDWRLALNTVLTLLGEEPLPMKGGVREGAGRPTEIEEGKRFEMILPVAMVEELDAKIRAYNQETDSKIGRAEVVRRLLSRMDTIPDPEPTA